MEEDRTLRLPPTDYESHIFPLHPRQPEFAWELNPVCLSSFLIWSCFGSLADLWEDQFSGVDAVAA